MQLWKKFGYIAMGAIVLGSGGCGFGGIGNWLVNTVLPSSVSHFALEFLADNDGVFDLFAD